MDDIAFRSTTAADPVAAWCLQQYHGELDSVFPAGFDPEQWGPLHPAGTDAPHGCFVVVEQTTASGVEPVGCGAVKTIAPGVGEIKRMWLASSVRGIGLGKALLAELERRSVLLGHDVVRLDTSIHLTTAVAMYRAAGYAEIDAYNDNPYAGHWFEKRLETA